MKPKEIGKTYDQIVHLWDNGKFDNKNGILQHQRAVAFTNNRGPALDVGCGRNSRIRDFLLDHKFQPEGVDVSETMVYLATKAQPDLTFYHSDVCTWKLPKKYDFITAWDSIWHVPLEQHAKVLSKLFSGLTLGGVCIFSAGGTEEAEDHVDSSMGPEVYYSTLGIRKTLEVIDNSGCVCRHFEYDQHPELHTYYIVQKIQ